MKRVIILLCTMPIGCAIALLCWATISAKAAAIAFAITIILTVIQAVVGGKKFLKEIKDIEIR